MPLSKKKVVTKSNLVERTSTPIRRHSAPTIYDQYPRGTECVVADKDLYIQNSADENNPCWEFMGPYTPPSIF